MESGFDGTDPEARTLEEPLLAIDSELNIFALANGLDLFRNRSDAPDRTLEWYREGMERRIVLRVVAPDRVVLTVGATRRKDGVSRDAERPLAEVTPEALGDALRGHLADGIERANELTEDDLTPA